MKQALEILLLKHLKKAGSFVFECVFFYVRHFYAKRFFAESNLYNISYLYVIGGFGISAVYLNMV